MHFVTGELVEIYEEDGLRMGKLRVAGTITRVVLTLLPEAQAGDVVLVHAGVAISQVRPEARPPDRDPTDRSAK